MKLLHAATSLIAALLLSCIPAAAAAIAEGDKLPAGAPIPVVDLKGQSVDLGAAVRRPGATLLVFWGTWCQPCLHEVPEIKEVARFYGGKGLHVVGVALKSPEETLERVTESTRERSIDYEVLFDDKDQARTAFGVVSLPTSLLIDDDGLVKWRGNQLPSDINERIKTTLGLGEERGAR